MEKEDLANFTRDELVEMFINLINEMEDAGNKHMLDYETEKMLVLYSFGAALLTRVNRVKGMILLKNSVNQI